MKNIMVGDIKPKEDDDDEVQVIVSHPPRMCHKMTTRT